MAKTGHIVDDDSKTAKDLWEALVNMYTTTNAQAILNLRTLLDGLKYDDKTKFEKHMERFRHLCEQLATYNVTVPEQ